MNRLVYEGFLEVFPSAYLILSAVLFYFSGFLSLFLFSKRRFLKRSESKDNDGTVKAIRLESLRSDEEAAGSTRF